MPVDYAHLIDTINGKPGWTGVIPAMMLGLVRAYKLNPWKYFNNLGLEVLRQTAQGCLQPGAFAGLHFEDMLKPEYQDWKQVPDFVRILNDSIMERAWTPTAPQLMAVGKSDGIGDGVIVAGDMQELAHTYCGRGVPVQFHTYNSSDHVSALFPFELQALNFMAQRYAGGSTNECGSIGPGNPLTPLPAPDP
jgi:hypothetical protein